MSIFKLINFVLLIFVYQISQSECDKNKNEYRSLYENSTAIISTSSIYLKQLINEKPYSSLIFLYQNWCEECIDQVQINLELEKELVYWQRILKFVTINYDSTITTDSNVSKSFEYKLKKPNSRSNQLISIDSNDFKKKDNLIKSILTTIIGLKKSNNDFQAIGWPKLIALDELDQLKPFTNKSLIFVNKGNSIDDSLISLEIILDFSNYTSELEFMYCNESVFINSNFTSKQHINLPALYQYNEQEQKFNLIGQNLNRREFRDLIISKFLSSQWTIIEVNTKSKIKNITNDSTENVVHLMPVHFRDLNNALRGIVFSDFTRFKVISSEKLKTMSDLMMVFKEYFIHDNENTRRFLRRISQWLREKVKNQTESMDVEKFKSIIKAGAEGFLPVEQPYISCNGSQSYLRGYPCSIWLLFHSLTVQEYLKQTNETAKTNLTLPSHTVLRSMKAYIHHFLPCESCVQHFEQDSMNLDNELINSNSSILWLWRKHNRLNLMLKNRLNDDPFYPKDIFPNFSLCQKCFLNDPGKIEQLDQLDKIQWNETEVANFLIEHYKKKSLMKSSAIQTNLSILNLVLFLIILLVNRLSNRAL